MIIILFINGCVSYGLESPVFFFLPSLFFEYLLSSRLSKHEVIDT